MVKRIKSEEKKGWVYMYTFEDLLAITKRLRAEDGCPWDRVQTHESLRRCMIEEAYEVVEAIDRKDDENLKEELGDVLLQVTMHSQIASEEKRFDITDVVNEISEKLIRRHPHVFGTTSVNSVDGVLKNWEEIKQTEKNEATAWEGLKRIPLSLPAALRAQKIQKKSEKAGYSFGETKEIKEKMNAFLGMDEVTEEGMAEFLFEAVLLAKRNGFSAEDLLSVYNKDTIEKILKENQ